MNDKPKINIFEKKTFKYFGKYLFLFTIIINHLSQNIPQTLVFI